MGANAARECGVFFRLAGCTQGSGGVTGQGGAELARALEGHCQVARRGYGTLNADAER